MKGSRGVGMMISSFLEIVVKKNVKDAGKKNVKDAGLISVISDQSESR